MYALLDSGNTTSGKVQDLVSIPFGGTLANAKGITAAQQALCVPIPVGLPVGVGWSYSNGTFSPPAPSNVTPPTLAELATTAIGAGLAITSTANGALGTFQLTAATQLRFASLLQYYDKFGTFPNKAATITVTDIDGKPHTLTPAQFEALYQTLGDYLTLLEDCIAGIATALPTASNFGTIP